MIATLIDYGAGNVTSVARAFRRLGAEVRLTADPAEIESATCLALPGVGHCAALLHSLDRHNLRAPIHRALSRGTPFLGICLGLQALYAKSAEAPELPGLNMIHLNVEHLPDNVKLPHMAGTKFVPRDPPSSFAEFPRTPTSTSPIPMRLLLRAVKLPPPVNTAHNSLPSSSAAASSACNFTPRKAEPRAQRSSPIS